MSGDINTGHDMWNDYKSQYGMITARVMCLRYLDLQANKTDSEEQRFCGELREAMAMERNMKDEPYYKASFEYARSNGEETLFYNSETANIWCVNEIDDAIRACEYGDGSHKLEPAAQALIDQFGIERLGFVLALEVRRSESEFSARNQAWSQDFDIQSGFASAGIRVSSDVLDELITCFRDAAETVRAGELAAAGHGIEGAAGIRLDSRQNEKEEAVMSSNMIRFITSDYKELFQIPDGGSIKINYPPGDGRAPITRACKYHDDYHFETIGRGGDIYHIAQFAEIMERLGAKYEPEVQLRNAELTTFKPGDEKFYTYNREEGNSCVGHISGDFGQNGDRFHSGWRNHQTRSEQDWSGTSPEFQTELHSAVYALRQDLLKDYDSMLSYCESHPEALIDSGDNYRRYGFKLETDTRQYYAQCFFGENMRDARFIVYAYENPVPELQQAQLWEVIPGTEEDSKMFYRNDAESSLSVGYLRGDFGRDGNEFHHSWFDSDSGRNTPEFKAELQVIVNGLRKDALKDLKSSQDFCYKHPKAQLPGDIHRYGFKVETKSRQYFVRCTVIPNDYFYVFAYDKGAAHEQERQASEKPSVLKQIRDAEKAPKPPRKGKAPDKKKDGAEL